MPDDLGVTLNSGRAGARQGPSAFRAALAGYGSAGAHAWPAVFDAGDVEPGDDLEQTHARVSEASAALVRAGLLPVGIGGGHDLTFAFVRGVMEATGHDEVWSGVYFDAHLDVREERGSGMPFRALVELGRVGRLDVLGLDHNANTVDHLAWFASNHGHVDAIWPDSFEPSAPTFASLDLDVIDQSFAPGVSAMNPSGWTPAHTENWVTAVGRRGDVRCFDIMELSPPHDESGRTARLAARMFLAFLRGLSERPR